MNQVFGDDLKKGPLDSRIEPARFEKLHVKYIDLVSKLEQQGKIQKLYVGVQCENCHENRNGHPNQPLVTPSKKVKETTCRTCHAPPNAPTFSASMIPKVSCPLMTATKNKKP